MQRSGGYRAPPGAISVLGLECAGIVAAVAAALLIAVPAVAQQQKPAAPAAAKPAAAATDEDKYVGYYYPKPNSTEVYQSSMQPITGDDRAQSVQIVT